MGEIIGKILAFLWFMLLVYAYMEKNKKKKLIAFFVCALVIAAVVVLILAVGMK